MSYLTRPRENEKNKLCIFWDKIIPCTCMRIIILQKRIFFFFFVFIIHNKSNGKLVRREGGIRPNIHNFDISTLLSNLHNKIQGSTISFLHVSFETARDVSLGGPQLGKLANKTTILRKINPLGFLTLPHNYIIHHQFEDECLCTLSEDRYYRT